jgi:Ni,Fe-hydrogenase III large subunit
MRLLELAATAAILDDLLAEPLGAGTALAGADAGPHGVAVVESPRGATTCAVEVADGAVRRIRLRTSSYANWPGVAHAAAGGIVPDFPLVNRSFELCYACVDR